MIRKLESENEKIKVEKAISVRFFPEFKLLSNLKARSVDGPLTVLYTS